MIVLVHAYDEEGLELNLVTLLLQIAFLNPFNDNVISVSNESLKMINSEEQPQAPVSNQDDKNTIISFNNFH